MKTYSGELKDGMPCRNELTTYEGFHAGYDYYGYGDPEYPNPPEQVHVDNEWQLYKPQAKKVWGRAKMQESYWVLSQNYYGEYKVVEHRACDGIPPYSVYLDKHTAEQHAKAMNYINEFRALSDVPVDGVEQWVIDYAGKVDKWELSDWKFAYGICGYVANSREKAKRDLAAFPKIALAHKIVTWGFHGIVEEVL